MKREGVAGEGAKVVQQAAAAKEQKPPPHLLCVRLVSAANGKPLAVDYVVESAQGAAVHQGKTDFTGTITKDPIDPGEYKVKVAGSNLVGSARSTPKASATKTPTDVKIGYRIEVVMKAIGGAPLRSEKVAIIDPATKKPVGEPVETDENGLLAALVPEDKEYDLQIVDDDAPAEEAEIFPPVDADGAVLDDDEPDAVLRVKLVDEAGKPIANESVKITPAEGEAKTITTQDDGEIEEKLPAGACTIEARGKTLHAHTVPAETAEKLPPYKVVVR